MKFRRIGIFLISFTVLAGVMTPIYLILRTWASRTWAGPSDGNSIYTLNVVAVARYPDGTLSVLWADAPEVTSLVRSAGTPGGPEILYPTLRSRYERVCDWPLSSIPTRRVSELLVVEASAGNPTATLHSTEERQILEFVLTSTRGDLVGFYLPDSLKGGTVTRESEVLWNGIYINASRSAAILLLAAVAAAIAWIIARHDHRVALRAEACCSNCGYPRVGLASDRCPECGTRW